MRVTPDRLQLPRRRSGASTMHRHPVVAEEVHLHEIGAAMTLARCRKRPAIPETSALHPTAFAIGNRSHTGEERLADEARQHRLPEEGTIIEIEVAMRQSRSATALGFQVSRCCLVACSRADLLRLSCSLALCGQPLHINTSVC